MKNLFFHIKYILLFGLLAIGGIVMAQDIAIPRDKGDSTFTAITSAESIDWFIDGVNVVGQTGLSFTKGLQVGLTYTISAIPSKGGCAGNLFSRKFLIKDDVTKGDKQIVITSPETISACPQSNVSGDSSKAFLDIEFRDYPFPYSADNYVLMADQMYGVSYMIDDDVNLYTEVLSKSVATLNIDTKLLLPGSIHTIRVMKLAYSSNGNGVIDMTIRYTKEHSPSVTLKVKPMLEIGEIKVIEE